MFGTLRQRLSGSSGRADETAADTKHPVLFIEVKYRDKHAVRTLYDATAKLAKKEGKRTLIALVDKGKPGFLLCLHIDDLGPVADEMRKAFATADSTEGFYEPE